MSQSPVDEFSEKTVATYKQGWRALNRLLHEDRSFSGNERNCAFLNTGGERASFADVSAVTGFGFPDDGRGLATVDWDFDGDLDLWITNRTAPRVRFLKNDASAKAFVAFKLQGDGKKCNRDAIGARLELILTGTDTPKRIRTLRGGEGFISQSSNWIHFGIGEATAIEKLVVKWPGSPPEEFTGLKPGQFYRIVQGAPRAEPFSPPAPAQRAPLAPAEQAVSPDVQITRTIVPSGLPFPRIEVVTTEGGLAAHDFDKNRPTVINIWSSTCEGCIVELTEWSRHRQELLAAGVDIITLSTDHLFEEGTAPATATREALARTGTTFPDKQISAESLQTLDALQQAVLDRWSSLPVPSTFLINGAGELVAVYRGAVSPGQLIQDVPLARASPEARRDAAVPFPGKWVGGPAQADPKRVSAIMLDHDRIDPAIRYLEHCIALLEPRNTDNDGKRDLGDLYYMAGLLGGARPDRRAHAIEQLTRARDLIPSDLRIRVELGKQLMAHKKPREALAEFTVASQINPGDLRLRHDIGLLTFRLGDFAASKKVFGALVEKNPGDGVAQYHLANTEVRLNNIPAAIEGYRKTLTAAPQLLDAANNLAWILACHPDENLRSEKEALTLAQRLCAMTSEKDPRYLDSLSAALANSGDFQGAIIAAEKAIAIYGPRNKQASEAVRSRVALYKAGQHYREPAWK